MAHACAPAAGVGCPGGEAARSGNAAAAPDGMGGGNLAWPPMVYRGGAPVSAEHARPSTGRRGEATRDPGRRGRSPRRMHVSPCVRRAAPAGVYSFRRMSRAVAVSRGPHVRATQRKRKRKKKERLRVNPCLLAQSWLLMPNFDAG